MFIPPAEEAKAVTPLKAQQMLILISAPPEFWSGVRGDSVSISMLIKGPQMKRKDTKSNKALIGCTVKKDGKLWVIVETLDQKNVCASPIIKNTVRWRTIVFLGEKWTNTRRKPIATPAKAHPKPDPLSLNRFLDIPSQINYS